MLIYVYYTLILNIFFHQTNRKFSRFIRYLILIQNIRGFTVEKMHFSSRRANKRKERNRSRY